MLYPLISLVGRLNAREGRIERTERHTHTDTDTQDNYRTVSTVLTVLNCLTCLVHQEVPPSSKLYVDLPGLRAGDSPPATIPTDISTTTARPDLVLISELNVTMLELTIPTNSRETIQAARTRKLNKSNYQQLISDLES